MDNRTKFQPKSGLVNDFWVQIRVPTKKCNPKICYQIAMKFRQVEFRCLDLEGMAYWDLRLVSTCRGLAEVRHGSEAKKMAQLNTSFCTQQIPPKKSCVWSGRIACCLVTICSVRQTYRLATSSSQWGAMWNMWNSKVIESEAMRRQPPKMKRRW